MKIKNYIEFITESVKPTFWPKVVDAIDNDDRDNVIKYLPWFNIHNDNNPLSYYYLASKYAFEHNKFNISKYILDRTISQILKLCYYSIKLNNKEFTLYIINEYNLNYINGLLISACMGLEKNYNTHPPHKFVLKYFFDNDIKVFDTDLKLISTDKNARIFFYKIVNEYFKNDDSKLYKIFSDCSEEAILKYASKEFIENFGYLFSFQFYTKILDK